jgi:hypothetical protein
MLIAISTIRGLAFFVTVTVITKFFVCGNELIACSIVLLIRFTTYNLTGRLLSLVT